VVEIGRIRAHTYEITHAMSSQTWIGGGVGRITGEHSGGGDAYAHFARAESNMGSLNTFASHDHGDGFGIPSGTVRAW
jgi:hypothetical protein